MNELQLPLLIEPDTLEVTMSYDNILIADLGKADTYRKLHVPGAVHLDYARIVANRRPVMGLLPDDDTLEQVFSSVGINADTHVIAYDDEGGGRAARLLWTLEVAGHRHYSLVNGGLHAWANEGNPCDSTPVTPTPGEFRVMHDDAPSASSDYILERLDSADTRLLDVRSPEEYNGTRKFAERAGHIPGAVNFEWTRAMAQSLNLRFKPDVELKQLLADIGITPDKEIIVYCQSHHRSAHTYMVLKHLGFPRVKGYAGSWSDWGNNPRLPIE
jgi:thiosulfate/3-mercaptopyruvate sulfurtransferase